MNNGSGLRVVLWLSGCDHKCKGCQNPQTWDANSGILFDAKAKEELFRELDKDYISGLTLTGGDPLHPSNLDGVLDIVTEFNKRYRTTQDMVSNKNDNHNMLNENVNEIRLLLPEKTIWLYTGYTLHTCKYFDKDIFTFTPNYYHPNPLNGKSIEVDDKAYLIKQDRKRVEITKLVDVLVDGRYIDSQRNISKKWAGSDNQRVIDIKKSLQQNEVVLYCD